MRMMTKSEWLESLKNWTEENPIPDQLESFPLFEMCEALERFIVDAAVEVHTTNTHAALALGIQRTTLVEIRKRLARRRRR